MNTLDTVIVEETPVVEVPVEPTPMATADEDTGHGTPPADPT